jgi:hypothetical protein
MSIQKKSLISTLKTAKKANVASQGEERVTKPTNVISKRKMLSQKRPSFRKMI